MATMEEQLNAMYSDILNEHFAMSYNRMYAEWKSHLYNLSTDMISRPKFNVLLELLIANADLFNIILDAMLV